MGSGTGKLNSESQREVKLQNLIRNQNGNWNWEIEFGIKMGIEIRKLNLELKPKLELGN